MLRSKRAVATALATLLATAGCAEATEPKPQPTPEPTSQPTQTAFQSGRYEATILAVSPEGKLVGRFRMEAEDDVKKVCSFTFSGQANGNSASVQASAGGQTLSGTLSASGDGIVLKLPGSSDLPGCGMVIGPMAEEGDGMPLDKLAAGEWTDLARVSAERAAFRAAPGGAAGKAYVVKGDVVGVQVREGDAVKAVYAAPERKPVIGWLAASEVAPLVP
jgi:hypothetical protein